MEQSETRGKQRVKYWELKVPDLPPSANEITRKYRNHHAFSKLKEYWRYLLLEARAHFVPKATLPRMVVVTLYVSRLRDPQNNYLACDKLIADELVKLQALVDDSKRWADLKVEQVRVKPGDEYTRIEISEER